MRKGTDQKNKLVALRRIEGQVRGIHRMIEDQRYCIDIMNAIEAVLGALKSVEAGILSEHLSACVVHSFDGRSKSDKEAKIREIHKLLLSLKR